jgi:DHA2 family multidrug resistance protein
MRNLGGAVGLASLNSLLDDRIDLHLARLHESVTWSRGPAMETLANMTAKFQALGTGVDAQGTVMGFADVFLMLTIVFVALAALGIVIKRPTAAAGGGGH